jgi:hypothetical protein
LAVARWTQPWDALVQLNGIAPQADPVELAMTTSSTLSGLADMRALRFVRVPAPGPQEGIDYPALSAAEIVEALRESGWRQVPPLGDIWFTATRKGERLLEGMLGLRLASRRLRALGRVVAGFADAVRGMVWRRSALTDRWVPPDESTDTGYQPWLWDDDAGLAGSRVPRRPPDRSGSGAVALLEPDDWSLPTVPQPWFVLDRGAEIDHPGASR